jgi:hypothetical protein
MYIIINIELGNYLEVQLVNPDIISINLVPRFSPSPHLEIGDVKTRNKKTLKFGGRRTPTQIPLLCE